jgi:REP element-mobilizing transposase RayT
MELRQPFYQQQMYHVFNRGNGTEPVFRCDQNYEFFMSKYRSYMDTWWDTHAWCLLPGEFHFIVTVRENTANVNELSKAISRAFGDFCNGYVQAYNKHHNRKGSLLRRAFKRRMIHKSHTLRDLTCYIHNHVVTDQLVATPEMWAYSSYRSMLFKDESAFTTDPLLKVFGSREQFINHHKLQLGAGSLELPYVSAA